MDVQERERDNQRLYRERAVVYIKLPFPLSCDSCRRAGGQSYLSKSRNLLDQLDGRSCASCSALDQDCSLAHVDPVFKERLANWLQVEPSNSNGSIPSAPSVPTMTAVHTTPTTPIVDTESPPSTVAASLVVPPTPLNAFAESRSSTRVSPPSTRTAPVNSESDPLVAPIETGPSILSLSEHQLTSLDRFACDETDLSLFPFVDKHRAAASQVCIDRLLGAFRMSKYHHDARESLWRRQESLMDSILYTRDKLQKLLEDSREVAQTALTRSETENDRLRSENARLFHQTRIVAEKSREQAISVSFLESVVEEEHLGREADATMAGSVQEGDEPGQVSKTVKANDEEHEQSADRPTKDAKPDIESTKPFGVYEDPGASTQAFEAEIKTARGKQKSVKFDTVENANQDIQPNDHAVKEFESNKSSGLDEKPKQGIKRKAANSNSKSKSVKLRVENADEKPGSEGLRRSGRTRKGGA